MNIDIRSDKMKQDIALLLKALADDNRLKILKLLIQGESCGCTLIDKLTITQPTLSYHMKELSKARLTISHKEGTMIKHRVDLKRIDDLIQFLTELKKSRVMCETDGSFKEMIQETSL